MSDFAELIEAIYERHGCGATHQETAIISGLFAQGYVANAEIEVFTITNSRATLCYAWYYTDKKVRKIVTVLGLPPVDSPTTAAAAASRKNQAKEAVTELHTVALHLLYHPERPDDRGRANGALRRLTSACAGDSEWEKHATRIGEQFSLSPLFSSDPQKHYGVQPGYEEIVRHFEHLPKISN